MNRNSRSGQNQKSQLSKQLKEFAKTFGFKSEQQIINFAMQKLMNDEGLQNQFIESLVTESDSSNDPELKEYVANLNALLSETENTEISDSEMNKPEATNEPLEDDEELVPVHSPTYATEEWGDDEADIQAAIAKVQQLEQGLRGK